MQGREAGDVHRFSGLGWGQGRMGWSVKGQRRHALADQSLLCAGHPEALQGAPLPGAVPSTSHPPSGQPLAASLEVAGCMIPRSWAKIFTFSGEADLRITNIGNEGFGMSCVCFDKLVRFCGCTVPRES